jgi:Rieske Fe-S protein
MDATRRNFLVLSIHGLGAVMSAALGIPALIYLFAPPRRAEAKTDSWIDIADVTKLPEGEPAEILFERRRVDGWKTITERTSAWVVKKSANEVFALAPACTHLACAYHWESDKGQFLCPCHTSAFSVEGAVLSGPAPRALDRYSSRVVNGRLQVGPIQVSQG